MAIEIITTPISWLHLKELAKAHFGDMVKVVVDVDRQVMVAGGELHADEEAILLSQGSSQENLWGINIYVNESIPQAIEFDSMINLRPAQNNRTRGIEDPELRKKIIEIVSNLIQN